MCPPTRWCDHTYGLSNMNVVNMYLLQDLLRVSENIPTRLIGGLRKYPTYGDFFVNCSNNKNHVLDYYQNIVLPFTMTQFKTRKLLHPISSRASNCILFSCRFTLLRLCYSILEIQIMFFTLPHNVVWEPQPKI